MSDLTPGKWQEFIVVDDAGHWVWMGPTNNNGYARKDNQYVHRVMYQLHVGPIPDGLEIDHVCRIRNCVNPEHLEAVTHRENMLRASALRTHCPHGHKLEGDNLVTGVLRSRGSRNCLRCRREHHAAVQAAAARLGLSRRQYIARYGWSRDAAQRVLNDG